ncbi:TonB-dependent receptor [Belliella sp. DSM 107340]|uniref:TonB-dependent receptor n=1 Tax=Belliella calami TaxID=2923436 RepID=A0ABS9UT69_9BACT|nr:TonB-dependent receptor [Belliella calami]MCH7399443.1 TonB-dependent receptor [Belliella calami]
MKAKILQQKISIVLLKSLFIILLSIPISVEAQTKNISGTVTDEANLPLPGVSILVKGTGTGTVTDVDGNYSLAVANEGALLVFSFIGYTSQEVAVGNSNTLNISLAPDIKSLEEFVVVGYGEQSRKDITGAVSVVGSEVFDARPNNQFGNLIQGKMAGVQVITPSGKPSAGFSIRIRGTNSISGSSEPLYVVDGVPTTDTRTINPADIENISVLKDASSAAIYGAQGANGVVLITTKKGKAGKPRFELSSYGGFSQPWRTLDVLNSEQYRDLMTEFGQITDWSRYTENTDWQNEIFQRGSSQNYQLSVSGKSEQTTYYISGGWTQQTGAVRSAEMDRYNFKINLEQFVNDWLKIGANVNYMQYHDVDVADNQAVNQGGVILGMLSTPPNIGIYNPDGTFTSNPFQDWENPVSSTDGSQRGYKNQRVLGNLYAEIDFTPELRFRSNVGIDQSNGVYDYFLDPFRTSYGRAMEGIARNNTDRMSYHIIDNTLTYSKQTGNHNFSALLGSVVQKYLWENNNIETRGFANDVVTTTSAGSIIQSASNTKSEKANASFLGRITYDFNEKYLLTANFRADGSSTFGPGNRWGYFPSFSVGWRLSEEQFMKPLESTLNDLKIRFGYGIVGNDQISNSSYAYVGRVSYGANYPIGGAILPGSFQSSIENRNLKWETTEQLSLGVDASFFDSRLIFVADAYIKNTSDLLLNVQLPRSTGFNDGIQNIGQLQNKGLEFQLSSVNTQGKLKWTTDFNISINRNNVVNIIGEEIIAGGIAGRGDVSYSVEGRPLGQFFGYVYGGVDPTTGNAFYIDKNGESTFTPASDDRTFIGNPHPDFIYGLTNTLSYKNFDLSIFLRGVQGNDVFNATRIEIEGMTDAKNQSAVVANRWRAPGDVTDIPRATWGNTNNSRISTRFVEDGSFLRVQALTLGYNAPQSLISKLNLTGLRAYVTGENLFTITGYKGFDPEVNAFGASNTIMGVDFGTYPQTQNIIFGVNISF